MTEGRSGRDGEGRGGGGCQTWSWRCIFVEAAAARGKEREGAFLPPLPFTFQHSYFLHSLVPYYFVYHVSHTNSHIYVTRSLPPPLLVEEEGEGRGEGGCRPLLPNEFSSPLPPLQFKLCRPGRPTFTWCQPSPGPGTVPTPSLYPKNQLHFNLVHILIVICFLLHTPFFPPFLPFFRAFCMGVAILQLILRYMT